MTYFFSGVIASPDERLARDSLIETYGGVGRTLKHPFNGWVVAFAADHDDVDDCLHEATTSGLVSWSRLHPGHSFVYIYVECWRGSCEQEGFAFRDGAVLHTECFDEAKRNSSPLSRLLESISIAFPPGVPFEPFSREWFPARNR